MLFISKKKSRITTADDKVSFQTVDNFGLYCQMWKLIRIFLKAKIIVFASNKPSKQIFSIFGQHIEQIYNYLSAVFSAYRSVILCKNGVKEVNKALHV